MKNVCSLDLILHNLLRNIYKIKIDHARKAGSVDTTMLLRDYIIYMLYDIYYLGTTGQTYPWLHLCVTPLHLHRLDRATGTTYLLEETIF